MTRAFRWMPHAGRRHAVHNRPAPNVHRATLCGVPLPVDAPQGQPYAHWCWPTCQDCDTEWRTHEGIPVFPRPRTPEDPRRACNR